MDLTTLPMPLERPEHTFSGRTVEVLRDLVLDGRLKAGERINEVELSTALGISRGPLREAIQHLRSEGLLTTVSHRGAFVRTFSERELSELYEVRIALETHALRLASSSMSKQAIADLKQLLAVTEKTIGAEKTYPLDLDFHQRIVSLADCQALTDAVVDVHRKIHLARSRSGHQSSRARKALSEHRDVLRHLSQGDGERAAEVLAAHLHSSLENALSVLTADEPATEVETKPAAVKATTRTTGRTTATRKGRRGPKT